jgi:hypothetical protein
VTESYHPLTASALIDRLNKLVSEHGDLPVMDEYNNSVDGVEYNDEVVRCFLLVITGVGHEESVSG